MAADEESTGKSRGHRVYRDTDEGVIGKGDESTTDERGAIPTAVPREGDSYKKFLRGFGDTRGTATIGEPGHELTDEDLHRINTREGLLQLLKFKKVNLGEVRKTLLYEQELRSLQVELVRLQRWM